MAFKDTSPQLLMLDVGLIDSDPAHPRRHIDATGLKALANSIQKLGLIHPLVVQPADGAGRHGLIVGERRLRAAMLAGVNTLPVLVHACDPAETLEVQVFENMGLGLRAGMEPRDMANALQRIAEGFASREAAAEHFGRPPTWLNQATAAAQLSPEVSALLDSGKIASAATAVQLEKLSLKNAAKAISLIDETAQLPEGEKLSRKVVDQALAAAGGRRKPAPEVEPTDETDTSLPWGTPASGRRLSSERIRRVAEIMGLTADDEDAILARLIDEFLAQQDEEA